MFGRDRLLFNWLEGTHFQINCMKVLHDWVIIVHWALSKDKNIFHNLLSEKRLCFLLVQ
jgi:hypothetical protein